MRARGFTLAELLVTITILTILMSIAGVMIGNAKSDAKKATCAFNLRQMSIGINTYLQDYDDWYPQTKGNQSAQPAIDDASGLLDKPDRGSLITALRNESTGIADCPSDPDLDGELCSTYPNSNEGANSYLANAYFLFGLNQGQISNGVASTIILTERRDRLGPNGEAPNCDVAYYPWYNPSNPAAPRNDMDETAGAVDTTRHQEGANYLYADGHATWRKWSQTYSPTSGINFHLPY